MVEYDLKWTNQAVHTSANLNRESERKMIFAFGAHGHAAGRLFHEHPWLFVGMIVVLIAVTIWNKYSN